LLLLENKDNLLSPDSEENENNGLSLFGPNEKVFEKSPLFLLSLLLFIFPNNEFD
jgi:hypothetical protein